MFSEYEPEPEETKTETEGASPVTLPRPNLQSRCSTPLVTFVCL